MVYIDMIKNTNNMEEWRPVLGFEGLYEISNMGRVRSLDRVVCGGGRGGLRTIKGRILKPSKIHAGYEYVTICGLGRKYYKYFIHRLVAITFIPNPNNYVEINHIDGDKTNNHVENLEWCSHQQNIQHAHNTGLIKKYKSRKVRCIETGMEFESVKTAAKYMNYHNSNFVSSMRRGFAIRGYHFEYID